LIQVFYDSGLDFFCILCKNRDWYFILNYKRGKTMQFKRILGLALVLSLIFVLAACTGAAATPTPEAEATTAVDSGDTGDTGGSADLPESASVSTPNGGTLTVNHPSGWTATPVDGTGSITLISGDAAQSASVTYYGTEMGADAATVIDTLATGVTASGGTAGDVSSVEINGRPASSVAVTVGGIESTYYVVTLEEGYAYVTGTGVDAATLEAIAASASFAS
jgi:hypothetical protein